MEYEDDLKQAVEDGSMNQIKVYTVRLLKQFMSYSQMRNVLHRIVEDFDDNPDLWIDPYK